MRTDAYTASPERSAHWTRSPPLRSEDPGDLGRRPRILVYGLNFSPELTGIGRYTGDMCAWLAEQGYEVTVITAYPYYPHWKLQRGYPFWRWSRERWNGVDVIRCPLWVPRQPTTVKRILHLLTFSLLSGPVAVLAALRSRPDIVFTVEPATFGTPWALLAAKLTGAQSWLHVQDLEMGAAKSVGLLDGRGPIGNLVGWLYGRVIRSFGRVTTLSARMRRNLAEYGREEATIELFPNWVDTEKFKPVDASDMRAELGLAADDVCVLYAGNLGEKQGIESLLGMAKLLEENQRVRIVICGCGAARRQILDRLAHHKNITLIEPLPDNRFVELLSAADIHILSQRPGVTHYAMPSKLGPVMAMGRIIVAQAEPECEVRSVLHGHAWVVQPDDPESMASVVGALANGARSTAAPKQRAYVEAFLARHAVLGTAFGTRS